MHTDTHTCGAVAVPATTQPAWDDLTRALRAVVQQEIKAVAKPPAPELVDVLRDVRIYFLGRFRDGVLVSLEQHLFCRIDAALKSSEDKR